MPDFFEAGGDFLAKSTSLRRHGVPRTFFEPTNPDHVASLKHYLKTGNWLQQFYPEDPFIDVPMTVFRKYIGHQLGVKVTNFELEQELRANLAKIVPLRNDTTNFHSQPEQHNSGQGATSRKA